MDDKELIKYEEKLRGVDSKAYYYPNLIKRLKEKGYKISDIARALNKDYYQVSRKINGIGQFKMTECKKICEFLELPFEIVFKTDYTDLK